MQESPPFSPDRPARGDLDPAALGLLERHGADIMLVARRYAATPDDAEDAFQRAFEILLTRAPTADEAELVPWLKTVVKHEAFALREARERQAPITADGRPIEPPSPVAAPHDLAESRERGLHGAEALARLKPQEVRALVLKARGLTYREIGERESWSYTKVNRLLAEGRRAFRRRLAGIEAGAECVRLEPLLSLLADGEADAEQIATLRPHLKSCLTCRARLKEFRSTPSDVAALVPHGAAATAGSGRLRDAVESLLGLAQHKTALLGERANAIVEVATGQKVAAIAASAAALAGGGAAVDELTTPPSPRPVVDAAPQEQRAPRPDEPPAPEPTAPDSSTSTATADAGGGAAPAPAVPVTPEPTPDPANEFDPSAAAAAAPQPAPAPQANAAPAAPDPGGAAPKGSGAPSTPHSPSPPGNGEFTP
jgi:RNA polymerase sigma factor (sigma-70 family)